MSELGSEPGVLPVTYESEGTRLSDNMARFFEHAAGDIGPEAFHSLTSERKTLLIEVACSPESRLSAEMQRQAGYPEAAIRCSHWNSCDLETGAGVKHVISQIDLHGPRHVWISPICGPYSPLQAINQRSPEQVRDLQEKRRKALKQYVGASCIFQHCIQQGIHVTWEWAERCLGWRLPLIQNLQKKYQPFFGVSHGCRVGLRDPKTQGLMHKGWKFMTTQQSMADLLERRCKCPPNYKHAKCEGGNAGMTAYYTPELVKLVCKGIFRELDHQLLQKEMEGRSCLLSRFGEGGFCVCQDLKHHDSAVSCGFCCQGNPKNGSSGQEEALVQTTMKGNFGDQEIQRKLYLLHAATGHCSTRHMLQALQRRGVSKRVLELAKQFKCTVCEESKRVNHKNVASLEPIPPKLSNVSSDGGKWFHPGTQEEYEFALVVDEGSRFRVARIMTQGKKQTMNAAQFLDYFQEGWIQYFGCPNVLRLDPSGAFRSLAVERFCDERGIFLDVIPGEAHWKNGICEKAIDSVKTIMTKLAQADHTISAAAALSEAVRTCNERELIRGYSPTQHILGRAPDETGRFVHSLTGQQVDNLLNNPSEEFEKDIERQKIAEQSLIEWQARERIKRALNSRAQKVFDYRPGDLVYFWRRQVKSQATGKNGMFLGPARILATESKRNDKGELAAGSSIWCVRGRRLIKCCPEQLRRASSREELLEHIADPQHEDAPWNFPRVAAELGGNEYWDISQDVPTDEDWQMAQDTSVSSQPSRRHSYKRPTQRAEPYNTANTGRPSRATPADAAHIDEPTIEAWSTLVADDCMGTPEGEAFWSEEGASVEMAIDLPSSKRGIQHFVENMEGFFLGAFKRRAVEVNEKRLTPKDYEAFQEAKQSEVRNFIAAKAFEALPPELRPPLSKTIGMRWILTWKTKEDGSVKPKARAILKGYQDPNYEYRATTTPVMTKQTRQFVLHETARRGWRVKKGDVTGAFLQGRTYPSELYCVPCPEILEAMGLGKEEIVKVKRGCYGLVDAPLEWYRSISEYLQSLGLVKSWADPCCWFWKPNGKLRAVVAGHVDDFLFSGSDADAEWKSIEQKIQQHFRWSDWEENSFTQCGVLIETQADGSFHLSQPNYMDKVSEINLSTTRKRDLLSPTTEHEKSQLRSVLGAISWHAQQVAPHYSAEVGLLLSDVTVSNVQTVIKTNQLLQAAKARRHHKMVIHAFPQETELGLYAWCDAAGQNRRDGGSTQGIFIGLGPMSLSQGQVEKVTPIGWLASKLDRVARSPGAAEAKATVSGEDMLFHARYQYGEFLVESPNIFDVDSTANVVPGCVISDSRNVFDKLNTEELSTKGAERRTDIELLCIKSSQRNNGLEVRWVHSEAQLSNALTKSGAKELDLYYQMGHRWRIVHDPKMMSAKKRKSQGINTFEQPEFSEHTSPV